jgi:hypothetical protein
LDVVNAARGKVPFKVGHASVWHGFAVADDEKPLHARKFGKNGRERDF